MSQKQKSERKEKGVEGRNEGKARAEYLLAAGMAMGRLTDKNEQIQLQIFDPATCPGSRFDRKTQPPTCPLYCLLLSLFQAGWQPNANAQQVAADPQLIPDPPRVQSVASSLQSSSLQNSESGPEKTRVTIKTLPPSLAHPWLLTPYLLWVLAFSRMCELQLQLSSSVDA